MCKVKGRVLNALEKEFEELVELKEEDFGKEFSEFGITSVSFLKIVVVLEKEFDMEFPDEKLNIKNLTNLNDVIKYIEESI